MHHDDTRQESDARDSECAIKGTLGQDDALFLTVIMAAIVPSRVALHKASLPAAAVAISGEPTGLSLRPSGPTTSRLAARSTSSRPPRAAHGTYPPCRPRASV